MRGWTMSGQADRPLPLALVILTLNEERHLPACLESARDLAAHVLVLDSGSTDRTVELARAAGADVVTRRFDGYASQRQAALGLVSQPWVLFLDADERLTRALRREVRDAVCASPPEVAGYWIPRRNIMWGRELRGGGWSPDCQLRLLRPGRARYHAGREVHEIVDLDGEGRYLREPLVHLNYDSLAEFRAKQAGYARMRAHQLLRDGRRPRPRTYLGQPAREFWRRFVTLGGYRDGRTGLVLASLMAWYELRTWLWVGAAQRGDASDTTASPTPRSTKREGAAETLPEPTLDVSVVVVSYNVRDLLMDCLASVEASLATSTFAGEVIVVDNGSTDGSAAAVRSRFPAVRVIEPGANLGFAGGSNVGIQAAGGGVIVLLNPDTTVTGDAIDTLARRVLVDPDVGIVGPRVVYPNGTTQPTRRRFPTLLTALLESTVVQDYWKDNRILRHYYVTDRADDEPQEVDWLVGACLAVRREAIGQVGLLDDRFFMYSEEVEWCHRLRAAGWRIVYCPRAIIVHHESASASQNLPRRQVDFDTSKVMLFERLYGRGTARVLRLYLLATYLLRAGIEGGKGIVGHKRRLRWERVALYLHAFRSGLRPGRRTP